MLLLFYCHDCGEKNDVKRSRYRLFEYPLMLALLRPYRCRNCWHRFYAFLWHKVGKSNL